MPNRTLLVAAAMFALIAPVVGVQAQDAMAGDAMAGDAMAGDAMAGDAMAGDAMSTMMSDQDLTLCVEEAQALSFPEVAEAAEAACRSMHNGEMMGDDAMAGDTMGSDAMSGDAMAPTQ